MPNQNLMDFVTVVSVGTGNVCSEIDQEETGTKNDQNKDVGYVTVLTIGEPNVPDEIIEEVLVYRLPGERLGFGLKFEGGTKTAEFVKRLFIQSCAPDSPASMVHCSWGKLMEGDEVLNIDSKSVTNMTRIDCVRCLKESNVVIKLLIRHFNNKSNGNTVTSDSSVQLTEDFPLVIAAEKKRSPPPPVPPRKIPRKFSKDAHAKNNNNIANEIDSTSYQNNENTTLNGIGSLRIQSYRKSGNFCNQTTDTSSFCSYRDRRISAGSLGPPDAEVYLDLFSQETGCTLSESDDTGSSISTIIDLFNSFPTTTNSSFAGSMPSTPTPVQKQLDLSNVLNPFDKSEIDTNSSYNYLLTKLASSQTIPDEIISTKSYYEKTEKNHLLNEYGLALQPPTNFQDAPLSYGNEDVGMYDGSTKSNSDNVTHARESDTLDGEDENGNCLKCLHSYKDNEKMDTENNLKASENEIKQPPVPLPRNRDETKIVSLDTNNDVNKNDDMKIVDLPRLIYLMPKCNNVIYKNQTQNAEVLNTIESVKMFLENEIHTSNDNEFLIFNSDNSDTYNSNLYNLNWNSSHQLATIGEDDEEGCQDNCSQKSCTPIVVIETTVTDETDLKNNHTTGNVDYENNLVDGSKKSEEEILTTNIMNHLDDSSIDSFENMDVPPSSSRQPPDGDEFPDYYETPSITKQSIFEEPSKKDPISWNNNNNINIWKNSCSLTFKDKQNTYNVRDKIAMFSNITTVPTTLNNFKKNHKSTQDIIAQVEKECHDINDSLLKSHNSLKVKRSVSSLCESTANSIVKNEIDNTLKSNTFIGRKTKSSLDLPGDTLYNRLLQDQKFEDVKETYSSLQNLVDNNISDKIQQNERWSFIYEQRQKNVSKLKGLIIPDQVTEIDTIVVLDLPEIKNNNVPPVQEHVKPISSLSFNEPLNSHQLISNNPHSTASPIISNNINSIPKYSPAFKRKSLQIHPTTLTAQRLTSNDNNGDLLKTSDSAFYPSDAVTSISNNDDRLYLSKPSKNILPETFLDHNSKLLSAKSNILHKSCQLNTYESLRNQTEDTEKLEYESDNDSAVSSSQSSYSSHSSPELPDHFYSNCNSSKNNVNESESTNFQLLHLQSSDNQSNRFLKPQSVEAINRKNILASAKCRSGRDLKISSPLIQRKFDDVHNQMTSETTCLEIIRKTSNNIIDNCGDLVQNSISFLKQDQIEEESNQTPSKTKLTTIDKNKLKNPDCGITKSKNIVLDIDDFGSQNKRNQLDVRRNHLKSLSTDNLLVNDRKNFVEKNTIKNEVVSNKVIMLTKERLTGSKNATNKDLHDTSIIDSQKNRNKVTNKMKNENHTNNNISQDNKQNKSVPLLNSNHEEIENKHIETIILQPEVPGGSVGITLSGGADYEIKEITIYKIREDSVAHRDGRLQKGDRVLSINNKSVKGLTHKQLVALLKETFPVTLGICKKSDNNITSNSNLFEQKSSSSNVDFLKTEESSNNIKKNNILTISLIKDPSGLGLSLEGGQDSLSGNMPLLIKKVFKGGVAEKSGKLFVGDELLSINETDLSTMSRFEAWSVIKKLPEDVTIILTVRR